MSKDLPPLWKHQKEGIEKASGLLGFAWFFEVGTGKSRTFLEILKKHINKDKRLPPTLIFAPVIALENWKQEILKFTNVHEKRIIILSGPCPKRRHDVNAARIKFSNRFIAITNYEGIVSSKDYFHSLLDWGPKIVVCDESHKIKTHNSKRTKLATQICDKAMYKYLLSGTPITNSPMDIFAQYRALDGGKTFGRNFFIFRQNYFYDKNYAMPKDRHFPEWVIREGSLESMNRLIYRKAMSAMKSECLDLPPLIVKTVFVELSFQQRKLYDEMKTHFITYLSDDAVVAELAITKALRLQQIITGFIKTDKGEIKSFKTPRVEALRELLEEIVPSHKVIVWCVFKENYKQAAEVCEKLKIKYVEVHGGIPNQKKYEGVEAFNTNPEVRVLIGHPGSAGIAINLVAASYSIYFSRNFSLEQDIQSEGRNYRGGSEIHNKITRINLVTKDSIDELIDKALKDKMEVSEKLLTMMKEEL